MGGIHFNDITFLNIDIVISGGVGEEMKGRKGKQQKTVN